MTDLGVFRDLLVVFALGVAVVLLFHRFRLPPIVGFLLTGVLAGPYGFRLIRAYDDVTALADVGVILLLFTIGLQLSFRELLSVRRIVLKGGALQVTVTIIVVAAIAMALGVAWPLATFLGMLVAHTSSTIILRQVSDRDELDTPHARAALGISIFQDLSVVPMVLAVPLLAGGSALQGSAWGTVVRALLYLGAVGVAARFVVPPLLERVVRTRQREAFVLTIALLALGMAAAAAAMGLSLSLGAFLAGVVLSESRYSQQALGEILPLRELFNILFFVSIGMLFDARTLLHQPGLVLSAIGLAIGLKAIIGAGVVLALGYSIRVAVLTGVLLAQVGEFSFVLSRAGIAGGLLDESLNQLFLAVAIGTMALAPVLLALASPIANRLQRALPARWIPGTEGDAGIAGRGGHGLDDHVVIVGYGLNGHNLARVLRGNDIPFIVIEMNPELARAAYEDGVAVVAGDATRPEIVEHAGIRRARVMVVAISDRAATRQVVDVARRLNPDIDTIVRTRYVSEIAPLLALGTNEIVPEEFETSVEIFSRVLQRYLVPRDVIESAIHDIRRDAYQALRTTADSRTIASEVSRYVSELALETYRVAPGSALAGRMLKESRLRERVNVTIVAIRTADGVSIVNPTGSQVLHEGDAVTILGRAECLDGARSEFDAVAQLA
jgi:CPA2 family monovalent cation:H+ antiporter-2